MTRRIRRSNPSPQAILKKLSDKSYWKRFKQEMVQVEEALAHKRKDAILHIRVNSLVMEKLKGEAQRRGAKYQTFISDLLERIARDL